MPSETMASFALSPQLLQDLNQLQLEGPYWNRSDVLRQAVLELIARQRPPAEIHDPQARAHAAKVHDRFNALAAALKKHDLEYMVGILREAMALAPEDYWQPWDDAEELAKLGAKGK